MRIKQQKKCKQQVLQRPSGGALLNDSTAWTPKHMRHLLKQIGAWIATNIATSGAGSAPKHRTATFCRKNDRGLPWVF